MRLALEAASDRVPAPSRTPATKAKMAQRIIRSAQDGITDVHQLVAVAVPLTLQSWKRPGQPMCSWASTAAI
jgi:hypothetical protein